MFDPAKTRDAIKRFGDHLKEKGGGRPGKGAQEAKTMLDAAMTLLEDLKQAVAGGQGHLCAPDDRGRGGAEPALAQVRQALSAPRIILAP